MSLSVYIKEKRFKEKTVLSSLSFDFPDTGLFLITGKSGIGKTTLLRIIAGLDKDFSGEIIGGGIKNTSFDFQEYRLFPQLSALENITLVSYENPGAQDVENAKKMLKEFGFSESEFSLLPSELSGGMKQRIGLIRAILKDTPILLLDEPTKELDPALQEKILNVIKKESLKRLVIMVSHSSYDKNYISDNVIEIK